VVASKKSGAHRVSKAKQVAVEKRTPTKPHAAPHSGAVATINRREARDRRGSGDRRSQAAPAVPVAVERRVLERRTKVSRRRQIDPTTCERDYTPEEIEFMAALDEYKRRNGRMFPTCSEVLEVLKSLGYAKVPKVEVAPVPVVDMSMTTTTMPTSTVV
jgi:hypothetical protein